MLMDETTYGGDAMLLLVGLYAHPDILAHTVNNCYKLQLFDPLTEPGYKALWDAMRKSHAHYGERPTPYMVNNDVAQQFELITAPLRPRAWEQLQMILPLITDTPPYESRERVRERLEKALQKAIGIQMAEESWTVMEVEEHAAKLSGMANLLMNSMPTNSVRKRPLAKDIRAQILRVTPRYRWGVNYWDDSGNSWYKKEVHGLLGPSGGGKTVNACNIAEALLRAGFKVAIALYEQALEEDVAQRLYANLGNVSMDHLRGKNYEEIDPVARAKMERAADAYVDKLMVLDMVGENAGTGGPQELFQHLQEERRETGFWPDMVIVDWLGEMALRYEKRLKTQDNSLRITMESIMSDLNQFKETPGNETTFLVLHQTSTNAQGAGPGYRPNRTDAHEFRSFANKCDSCCQLGNMDSDGLCWYIPGKIRRGQKTERILRLDPKYMRFEDVSDHYQAHPGGGGFISNDMAADRAEQNSTQEDFTADVQ
jgi:hypothetical protein